MSTQQVSMTGTSVEEAVERETAERMERVEEFVRTNPEY